MKRATGWLWLATLAMAGTVLGQDLAGDQDPQPLPPLPAVKFDPCPPLKSLGYTEKAPAEISLNIGIQAESLPPDCSTSLFATQVTNPRTLREHWPQVEFNWAATEFYHQPLYFEDIPLERYGQAYHPLVQPWLSGARFFATFPIVPYKMGIDRTHDRIYSLGYYRPGSPSPCVRQRLPFEWDAATLESAVWLALVFALP